MIETIAALTVAAALHGLAGVTAWIIADKICGT